MKKSGVRTINLTDDFIELVKDYPNRYFVTNEKGGLYKDASGLSKKMRRHYGFLNYTLRKAKSSVNLIGVDTSVADAQGHSLGIQNDYYRDYK